MTTAREAQALAASVAVHLLLLLIFAVARQPLRELAPLPALRLTFTPDSSASVAGLAASRAAPPAAPESFARQQAAAGQIELPPLAAPRTGFATTGPGHPALPAASAGAAALPTPAAALAGALTAGRNETANGAAPSAPAPELPPAPRIAHSGLPGVRRGMALGYPAELMRRGIEADVEMRLTVAADGSVVRIETLQSSGVSSVDVEVEQALRQFLFAASAAGPVTGKVRVSFRLERSF